MEIGENAAKTRVKLAQNSIETVLKTRTQNSKHQLVVQKIQKRQPSFNMASPAWKKIAADRQKINQMFAISDSEIKKETKSDEESAKHLQDLNDFKQPSFNMAWNKIAASTKIELSNIMSEQKINQMFGISESEIKQETETDEAVAKRLQEQYDFEYCEDLERENTQKTTITNPNSVQNYSDYENSDSDSFEYPSILQTKHKVRIDRSSFSKTIQSQLQKYSAEEEKRKKPKIFEKKDRSTVDHAFDDTTRKILYGLLNHNVLISLSGIVSVGKEAVVQCVQKCFAKNRPFQKIFFGRQFHSKTHK